MIKESEIIRTRLNIVLLMSLYKKRRLRLGHPRGTSMCKDVKPLTVCKDVKQLTMCKDVKELTMDHPC